MDKQLRLGFTQMISWYIRDTITWEELLFLLGNRLRAVFHLGLKEHSFPRI